jgi:sterol-4alpha-carboxylate 3-dehydrogenase (decarboxylating)
MDQTNVLVTGGCGFLGTVLISKLLETKRYSITAVDINPPSLGSTTFTKTVRYVRADILDPSALEKVFAEAKPAIVVHTVAIFPTGSARYSITSKDAVFKINVEGTRNVLHATKECGAKGLVYTSSVTVVLDELDKDFRNVDETWPTGGASTIYGQSKAAAEALVLAANTPTFSTCALRSSVIFGPNDAVLIPTMHALIGLYQTPFILGSATNLQDFVYVDNVADAHVLAVANLLNSQTAAGEAMFVTNGEPVTLRDFCRAVWREFGHVPRFNVTVPETVAWWVGVAAECVSWMTGVDAGMSRGIVSDGCRDRYVSINKARMVLGYRPKVGLAEAVRISCEVSLICCGLKVVVLILDGSIIGRRFRVGMLCREMKKNGDDELFVLSHYAWCDKSSIERPRKEFRCLHLSKRVPFHIRTLQACYSYISSYRSAYRIFSASSINLST